MTTGAFVIHNVEELTGLPAWLARLPLSVLLSERTLSYAMAGLTVLVSLVLLGTRARPEHRLLRIMAAAVAGALLANVASHPILSALTRSYMPGTGTALALVLPAALWLLWSLPSPRLWPGMLGAVLMVPVLCLALFLASLIAG
nr:HXXEE domain-containing protein [Maritimibacter sp. DP1N21-5]